MAAVLLWIAGVALESLILFRCLKDKLFSRYPYFCIYLAIVWASSILLWPVYQFHRAAYTDLYWAKQFLALAAGFAVLFEIVRKSFRNYPGARTFATAVLGAMLAILAGYFVFNLMPASIPVSENFSDLERDFRTVQAITLCGVLVLVAYYRIDLGRNLRGIIAGLGVYVGSTILSHAIRGYAGPRFDTGWNLIQPYTYFVSLAIWTVALWSYAPASAPQTAGSDQTYDIHAEKTKVLLGTMRGVLGRVERE